MVSFVPSFLQGVCERLQKKDSDARFLNILKNEGHSGPVSVSNTRYFQYNDVLSIFFILIEDFWENFKICTQTTN